MRFGPPEVARAKTLKAVGFPWEPRLGDWFVDHRGFCDVVRSWEQCQTVGRNGHAFLPGWEDCRAWLADRGWSCPEIYDEDDGVVHMLITHQDGRVRRAAGASDLDCLYRIILGLLLNG